MSNPTVFPITIDDVSDIVWLVDNPEPVEMLVPGGKQMVQLSTAKESLDLIKATIEKHGEIFASFYRPGAFWEEEVFVCPKCKHATQIELADSMPPAEWYCKYCYTAWSCSAEHGMFRVLEQADSD